MRNFAINGSHHELYNIIRGGGNVCSTDSHGFTALHYSVYNGHVSCVKVLLANDQGTFSDGKRGSCVNMQSKSKMTALHVSVMMRDELLTLGSFDPDLIDTDTRLIQNRQKCAELLVMSGKADLSVQNLAGQSALDMVNTNSMQCTKEMYDGDGMRHILQKMCMSAEDQDEYVKANIEPHKVVHVDGQGQCEEDDFYKKADTGDRKRSKVIPIELDMHEHHIYRYAMSNYRSSRENGASVIRNMVFALDQAEKNLGRRERLANSRTKGSWKIVFL